MHCAVTKLSLNAEHGVGLWSPWAWDMPSAAYATAKTIVSVKDLLLVHSRGDTMTHKDQDQWLFIYNLDFRAVTVAPDIFQFS